MKNLNAMMKDIAHYFVCLYGNWSMENFRLMMKDVSQYLKELWEDCFDLDMYLMITMLFIFFATLFLMITENL